MDPVGFYPLHMESPVDKLSEGEGNICHYRDKGKCKECHLPVEDQHYHNIKYEDDEYCQQVTEGICHKLVYPGCIAYYPVHQLAGLSVIDK